MYTPQIDKKAKVKEVRRLTKDSVELVFEFEDEFDFSYAPGQFIQLKILEPRHTQDWKIITKTEVYNVIREKNCLTKDELETCFPNFPAREITIEKHLHKLYADDAIDIQENTIMLRTKIELPVERPVVLMRPYSLGSTPTERDVFSTMIKETPDGFMSYYVNQETLLKKGDRVAITGPLGHFYFQEGMANEVLLIGAGSGITPLIGIARYAASLNLDIRMTLLYSNKTPEDIIYYEELKELTEQYPSLKVIHTITRLDPILHNWTGRAGRIDKNLISENWSSNPEALFYICGPLEFGKGMKTILTDELGVNPETIKLEAYG